MNAEMVKAYASKLSAERNRRVTRGEAEEDIVRIIQGVARSLAPSYVFGYHSREDIEQEALFIALEVLCTDKYDASRPLENFMHVHLHHQLYNYRRNHYMRLEPPCTCCDTWNPPAEPCKKWRDWAKRNASKQNLMRPIAIEHVSDEDEPRMASPSSVYEEAVSDELLSRIDSKLPVDLRSDYLRMREHIPVPKARRQRVREAVLAILAGSAAEPPPLEGQGGGHARNA